MEYEHILLQKRGIKVYNIPPMTSNKGHFLDSWKDKICELDLKVKAKGQKCTVYLINYDGSLFASAPMPDNYEKAVVKCADSSRGFALRLQDPSGKTAWIGISFTERNDSFDFQACLQDFEKGVDMERNPQKYAAENKPTQDFSLKKGEKITLNIGGGSSGSYKPKSNFTGEFKLPPPPGTNNFGLPPPNNFGLPPPQSDTRPAPTNNTTSSFGGFGGFDNQSSTQGGFSGFQNPTQSQPTYNAGNNLDLLGDLDFSGGQPSTSNQPTQQKSNIQQGSNTFDLL